MSQKTPEKFQVWIEARKQYHLSHADIQMARELGMNPKKFGKIANHRQEPWKLPLPQFIEKIYFKHFGKNRPDRVLSIEERVREIQKKKAKKNAHKGLRVQLNGSDQTESNDFSTMADLEA